MCPSGPQSTTRNTYRPLDAIDRQQAKQYYKLIQAIHHRNNINTAIFAHSHPPNITRQAYKLVDSIKPAAPTQHTKSLIKEATTHWISDIMDILQKHYEKNIQTILTQDTTASTHTVNHTALQVAIQWAEKKYKHRLKSFTIALLKSTLGLDTQTHTPRVQTSNPQTHRRTVTGSHTQQTSVLQTHRPAAVEPHTQQTPKPQAHRPTTLEPHKQIRTPIGARTPSKHRHMTRPHSSPESFNTSQTSTGGTRKHFRFICESRTQCSTPAVHNAGAARQTHTPTSHTATPPFSQPSPVLTKLVPLKFIPQVRTPKPTYNG